MVLFAVVKQMLGAGGIGKINDDIAIALELKRIGKNRENAVFRRIDIKSGNNLHALTPTDNIGDDAAHAAVASGKCNF